MRDEKERSLGSILVVEKKGKRVVEGNSFDLLLDHFSPLIVKQDTILQQAKSPHERLMIDF